MESSKNHLQVQDFLLSFASENSVFHLEAKERSTGRILAISVAGDVIGQITNGLFNNAQDLTQGLKDAIIGGCPELNLTLDTQGKLTYTVIFSAGKMRKEDGFSMNLIEKQVDPNEANVTAKDQWKEDHEFRIVRLEQTVHSFQGKSEERFNKLENMMLQMEQKMAQRLDAIEKLFKVPISNSLITESPESPGAFNFTSENASHFDFYDNDRRIKLRESPNKTFNACLEIVPEVPKKGQSSYSIRVNAEREPICFGITTVRTKQNWNGENTCNYRYWSKTGQLAGRVPQTTKVGGPFGGKDTVIKMVVDMDAGTLKFLVGSKEINSCKISTSDTYFAYVSLGGLGDSVTLL